MQQEAIDVGMFDNRLCTLVDTHRRAATEAMTKFSIERVRAQVATVSTATY